jgi:hypothetical protein
MEKINKTILYLFLLVVIVFDFMFLMSKKETYSYLENRYLKKFNINEIDGYLSDHFPFRNTFLAIKNRTELAIGKTYINDTYIGKDNYLIPTFVNNSKSHYIYESINDFAKDKQVYVMFVPDSILINEDKLYYHLDIEEDKEIDNLYSKLSHSTNIDVRKTLKEHNNKEEMYYKTDHHWTSFGAYYGYVEFMKNKGDRYLEKEEFEIIRVSSDFVGTTSSKVLGLDIKDDIYTFNTNSELVVNYVLENKTTNSLYNEEYLDKKDKYSYFLDNNHSEIVIHNKSINNGEKILVIKNSYGNCFIPFLVNHYEYVHVVDLRYFNEEISEYLNKNDIYETLILYNLNNLYSDLSIVKLR